MTTTKPNVNMLDLDVTGTEVLYTNTDPGAGAGPSVTYFRDSASPVANDLLGYLGFDGRDSLLVRQNYASITAQILDPAQGTEDGALSFSVWAAGASVVTMTMLGGKIGIGNSSPQAKLHVGAATGAAANNTPSLYVAEPGSTILTIRDTSGNYQMELIANGAGGGTAITTTGPDGARQFFAINGQNGGFFHDQAAPGSGADFVIGNSNYTYNDPQQIGAQLHSNPYTTTAGTAAAGTMAITSSGTLPTISVNRASGDGELMAWYSAGTFIGNITCAGGVVSYNAFSGSHWSQLHEQVRVEIARGTIVESIDELCSWENEDPEFDEHLPKFKISDEAGSRAVYGVFTDWSENKSKGAGWGDMGEFTEDDAIITSLGAAVVRIASGITVARGDLIESNGDGCGRVQADDVFRASTVAKVTASVIIETYSDGSYLVPCTLHCG